MMSMGTMGEKFVHDLGAILDGEQRFLEAQQMMLAQASSPLLQQMLAEHIAQTQQQILNLEQIFGLLGAQPARASSMAAEGLVADGNKAMSAAQGNPLLLDCVIASAAAKVEHFEMACYRGLLADAEQIDHPRLSELLRMNLQQEEQTAQKVEANYPALLRNAVAGQRLDRAVGGAPLL
jgi:ferritin-like metal-binding protein YciE